MSKSYDVEVDKVTIGMSGRTDVELELIEGTDKINFRLDTGENDVVALLDPEDMLELATELLMIRKVVLHAND